MFRHHLATFFGNIGERVLKGSTQLLHVEVCGSASCAFELLYTPALLLGERDSAAFPSLLAVETHIAL